jgi:hypothetical protein
MKAVYDERNNFLWYVDEPPCGFKERGMVLKYACEKCGAYVVDSGPHLCDECDSPPPDLGALLVELGKKWSYWELIRVDRATYIIRNHGDGDCSGGPKIAHETGSILAAVKAALEEGK